ncbi:MAG: acyltransferase family protein [Solirubrobacteraceae bacterium]
MVRPLDREKAGRGAAVRTVGRDRLTAAPAGLRPPAGHPRFRLLDSVRGFSVLLVILTHVAGYTHAFHGLAGLVLARSLWVVAGFFMISGFLLYRPWVAARVIDVRAPTTADYLTNRAMRILPGFWAALLLLAIWPGLPQLSWPFGHNWWAYWGLIQVYRTHWIFGGIGQAWTVCIEATFYISLPVWVYLAKGAARRAGFVVGMRVELVALAVLAALSTVFRVLFAIQLDHRIALYTLPSFFAWFAIGMALALIDVDIRRRERRPQWVVLLRRNAWLSWVVAAGLLIWVSKGFGIPVGFALLAPFSHRQMLAEYVLEAGVALCVLLPAIFAEDAAGIPQRVLASWPLQQLGAISYGVYLWHSAILAELFKLGAQSWLPGGRFLSLAIIGVPPSLLLGWLSYRFVERPFLLRKRDPGASARRPAGDALASVQTN